MNFSCKKIPFVSELVGVILSLDLVPAMEVLRYCCVYFRRFRLVRFFQCLYWRYCYAYYCNRKWVYQCLLQDLLLQMGLEKVAKLTNKRQKKALELY